MTFQTRRITLAAGAAPINLAEDADFGLSELGELWAWIAVQNVSTRIARYQETTLAPAGTAIDVGHTLSRWGRADHPSEFRRAVLVVVGERRHDRDQSGRREPDPARLDARRGIQAGAGGSRSRLPLPSPLRTR